MLHIQGTTMCIHCLSVLYNFFQSGASEHKAFESCLTSANAWLLDTQIKENPSEYVKYYRQMNKVHLRICSVPYSKWPCHAVAYLEPSGS